VLREIRSVSSYDIALGSVYLKTLVSFSFGGDPTSVGTGPAWLESPPRTASVYPRTVQSRAAGE